MSWMSDVTVADVRIRANHVPELITRLRWAGYPSVAHKVQRVLDARTLRVDFGPVEREAIVRALPDRPPPFAELCDVLLREINQRRTEGVVGRSQPRPGLGDVTPSRGSTPFQADQRPLPRVDDYWPGRLRQAAGGEGSSPRPGNDAGSSRARESGQRKVTVTHDTLRVILRQSLQRTRSKPPQPSYQQIADDNDVKRTWVTPIVKWAEKHPREARDALWMSRVPARFSTIVRD